MVTITESAQEYLAELLSKQEDALGVRVFINQPGTPRAETCIAYCREGDLQEGDEQKAIRRLPRGLTSAACHFWRTRWLTTPRIAWAAS